MKVIKYILLLLLLADLHVFSQSPYPTRDSTYIFWQEENRLIYNDYKGPSVPGRFNVVAEQGTWTVLDLPAEISATQPTLFYIAPVCDRMHSHADSNNTILIEVDNIYFDISEVMARAARKKITAMKDSLLTPAAASAAFKLLVRRMHEDRLRTYRQFYAEVFRNKAPVNVFRGINEEAVRTWRNKINEQLKSSAEWATKPLECYRFLVNAPLEKGYTEDVNSNARVIADNYEQVLEVDTWHAGFNQPSRQKLVKK